MKRLQRISNLFLFCVAATLVVIVVFLCVGRIERSFEAGGEVRIERYHLVRPQTSGLVVRVPVEPGTEVTRGQVLIELRDETLRHDLIAGRQSLEQVRSRLAGLRHESRMRREIIYPLEIEGRELELSRGLLQAQLTASRTEEAEIDLRATQDRHQQARELAELGLISSSELREARQAELAAEQRLLQSRLQEQLVRAERPAEANSLELLKSEQRRALGSLEAEIRELEAQMDRWTTHLEQLEWRQEQQTLRATMDGVVIGKPPSDLLGRYIQAGEELLSIIDVASICFVTHVPEQAIVQVRSGLAARVEIAGLPKNRFKLFSGRVGKVAQRPDLDSPGELPLYPVQIELQAPWVSLQENRFYLRGGMRGTAEIAYRHDVRIVDAILEFLAGKPSIPLHEEAEGQPQQQLAPAAL